MARPLYLALADRLGAALASGAYAPGEKLPSLRALSEREGVSLNTAKEAYAQLEARGLIEGRSQSGFFVRRPPLEVPGASLPQPLNLDPRQMSLCRLFAYVPSPDPEAGKGPLALAVVDPLLLPYKALERHLVEQTRLLGPEALKYVHTPGDPGLRKEVARLAVETGLEARPDEILITSGCTEAVSLALQTVCRPGDTVALEAPGYGNFPLLCSALGLKVLEIPADPGTGLDLGILRFALDHHPVRAVLVTPNFQNPTGALMPDENKAALVALLAGRGIPLIEDDIYGELGGSGPRPRPCKAWDRSDLVIYCTSFSKDLAPGWRVGWTWAGRFREGMENLKSLLSPMTGSVTQKALAAYLREEAHARNLRVLRQRLTAQRAALREAVLKAFPSGTRVSEPRGGLTLWVDLPDRKDSLALYRRALGENLVFAPGAAFAGGGGFGSSLRLCAGAWNPAIEAQVRRLGALAAEAPALTQARLPVSSAV